MLAILILVLIFLWFIGYIHISGFSVPDINLFAINSHQVTLVELLIFLLIIAAAEALPSPFRQIAFVILLIWLLSTLGILVIFSGLASILVLAIILGLILALFGIV